MSEVMLVNLDECVQNILSMSVLEREVILVGRLILGRMLRVHRVSNKMVDDMVRMNLKQVHVVVPAQDDLAIKTTQTF